MIYGNKSIKEVISKVYRDFDIQNEEAWINMIEWAAEALEFIGSNYQYLHVVKEFEVQNYRLPWPCGFVKLEAIEFQGLPLAHLPGQFDYKLCDDKITALKSVNHFGFTINPGFINTNFNNGKVSVAYLSLPIDDDGFPLIPDHVSYREAIYRYIVYKMLYPKFVTGTITQTVYADAQLQWKTYCTQARAQAQMPDVSRMENIKEEFLSLIPHISRYNASFRNLGLPSDSIYNNL